ncbi:MAG TPA: hypothetical protein DD400_04750 [Rhodospirillaceae bacterium]|nr:hypothetical protein [Rhodospirillaceae bacterium]
MKIVAFLLILFVSFVAPAHAASSAYDRVMKTNKIVLGVIPWSPYREKNLETKEWSGFAVEVCRRAFATMDIKVTFKEVIFGMQVQDLNIGRVDAHCDEGPWTMSAGKFVEFSMPYFATPVFPFVRAGEMRFKKRSDLNHPSVHFVGIDGDLSSDLVHRIFPKAKFSSMSSLTDVSQLYLNVSTGKADAVIGDPASFGVFNKSNPGKLKPLFQNQPLGPYKSVVSVKKGDMKLLGLVNQAIDNALTFGIVDEILDRYDPKHEILMRVKSRYTF